MGRGAEHAPLGGRTPAVARDWMVELPIFSKLIMRNSSPKPGISFS